MSTALAIGANVGLFGLAASPDDRVGTFTPAAVNESQADPAGVSQTAAPPSTKATLAQPAAAESRKWWRAVHSTSFVLFILSTVHAFAAGSDRRNAAMQWAALLMCTVFIFLVAYRQAAPRLGRASGRPAPAARTAPRTPHPAP